MAEITGEPLRPEDGLDPDAVSTAVAARGFEIPQSLRDYYVVAGRHWINTNHNRLLPIAELEWEDDRLVFMFENQVVAYWAIARADQTEADPFVWEALNGESVEWRLMDYRVSQFVMSMWRFTMTGEQEDPT